MAADAAVAERDREIVITRVLDAPRELVWRAFTEPAHLARWWGPQGFSTRTSAHELRPGGRWRFAMIGPDGHEYPNLVTFHEVVPHSRLVYQHGGERDAEPVNFHVEVTFDAETAARTRLTMRMTFASAQEREHVVTHYNAIEGGRQTTGRLADYVRTLAAGTAANDARPPFEITRLVRAPRELVWRAWTQREHLMQWFGPKGVTMPVCTLDFREGGRLHYAMQLPDGSRMWGLWAFREIVPGEKLVFVSSFADEHGAPARAPWEPNWPLYTLSTITFAEHAGIGRGTTAVVHWVPLDASDLEHGLFDAGRDSMRQGWTGTFEQLDVHVARMGGAS